MMPTPISYTHARPWIMTGDLIGIRSHHGGLPALTRWVTGSPYTHTGIAVWVGHHHGARLLIAETKGSGASLAPLSQSADMDFDIYPCPVQPYKAEQSLWQLLGGPIGYDFADLFRIAAHKLFAVPLPPEDHRLVCSALSAAIYLGAGWTPLGLPSIPAPGDVVAALAVSPKLIVRKDAS